MTLCQIHNVAFGGEGVGRVDNFVLFVPFTLPGELVEAAIHQKKKNFAHATLQKVLEKSPERVEPPCPYFFKCGGCQLQHASYSLQLEIKKRFVEDSLLRIGKISFLVPPVIPSSHAFGYRRHISLKVQLSSGSFKLGFTSIDGHSFTPVSSCLLLTSTEDLIIAHLQAVISKLNPSEVLPKIVLKIIKNTPQKYIAAFSFSEPFPNKELDLLEKELKSLTLLSGFILKSPDQLVEWGDITPSFSYNEMVFFYSPFGFVQNHPEQSEKIYDWILKANDSSKKILDLYCGIGVSSIALAQKGIEVIGVELNPISIELARKNASSNHVTTAKFFCCSAEEATHEMIKSMKPDALVVNPPKAGIDQSILESICDSSVQKLTYISCSPPSLARDLAFLLKRGFIIQDLQSFDMFPQTTHVETAVQLIRD